MTRVTQTLCAATLLTISAGALAAKLGYMEEAYETTTLEAALPLRADGTIIVRTCATCQPATMPLTPQTRYRIGNRDVTFADFSAYLREAGEQMMVVLFDPRKRAITQLAVDRKLSSSNR